MPDLQPTALQKMFRALGHLPLPKMQGLLYRLGAFSETKPRSFRVIFDQIDYRGRLDQHVDRWIYFLGAFAAHELDLLALAAEVIRHERGSVTFLDVGANVGQHSLFMAKRVDRVMAFEPNNVVADQFSDNVRANNIDNVEILRVALGEADGDGILGSGFVGNNGARSLLWSLDDAANVAVKILHGDAMLAIHDVERVDIIKIDVEGYERFVLAGLRETLERDRPVVLFELMKGFASEAELRAAFYKDHALYSVGGSRTARLEPFQMARDEAVCLPQELADRFRQRMR